MLSGANWVSKCWIFGWLAIMVLVFVNIQMEVAVVTGFLIKRSICDSQFIVRIF